MNQNQQNKPSLLTSLKPFLIGGASGATATCVIQPIDMVKVMIQIKSEEIANLKKSGGDFSKINTSPFAVIKTIYTNGGVKGFYRGLDSAITRQLMYGTARLGGYRYIYDYVKVRNDGKVSIVQKALASLTSGFLASFVGNPADLALTRMQNDLSLPENERRNYKNVFSAFSTIIKDEGILMLWRGVVPTICRAMSMNLGMLTSFDETKERLNKYTNTENLLSTRLISSCIAGFFGALFSLPFDNAKTKMQKMKPDSQGILPYKNIYDCLQKTVRYEGVSGLWVGFPVFWFRVAPHAMISLLTMEFLTDKFNNQSQKI